MKYGILTSENNFRNNESKYKIFWTILFSFSRHILNSRSPAFQLLETSHYLKFATNEFRSDPFLCQLNHMIDQERYICELLPTGNLNFDLYHQLLDLRKQYQELITDLEKKKTETEFDVGTLIQGIKQIPMVKIF